MHKARRPVINPQWVTLGVWGGEPEGHKEDHRAAVGGCHTPQSIVGYLTPAGVSAGSSTPPPPHQPGTLLSNEHSGMHQQSPAETNANTAFAKHQGCATCVCSPEAKGRVRH